MKFTKAWWPVLAGTLLVLAVACGSSEPSDAEVTGALTRFQGTLDAAVRGDLATMEAGLAQEYVSSGGDAQLTTKAEVLEALRSGDLKYTSFKTYDHKVKVLSASKILLTGSGEVVGTYKGSDISGRFGFETVLVKPQAVKPQAQGRSNALTASNGWVAESTVVADCTF